jgi:hypothetical protein
MGLDLYHAIPSLKMSDHTEYLTMDEFEHDSKFLVTNRHLLTEADETERGFEILVFPDIFSKGLVIKSTPGLSGKPFLVGDINNLNPELTEVATKNSVKDTKPLIVRSIDYVLTKETLREIYYHTVLYKTGSKKVKVLYWTTKGYQRKGMNKHFYEAFENNKLYFDKASVIKASSYLQPTWGHDGLELRKEFERNFIDNFIEGESIFFGNW